jgi:hypothetical protein
MTAYQKLRGEQGYAGDASQRRLGAGYGFSMRSENEGPLVTLLFGTREHAE